MLSLASVCVGVFVHFVSECVDRGCRSRVYVPIPDISRSVDGLCERRPSISSGCEEMPPDGYCQL